LTLRSQNAPTGRFVHYGQGAKSSCSLACFSGFALLLILNGGEAPKPPTRDFCASADFGFPLTLRPTVAPFTPSQKAQKLSLFGTILFFCEWGLTRPQAPNISFADVALRRAHVNNYEL
jgi:hypothetical protein